MSPVHRNTTEISSNGRSVDVLLEFLTPSIIMTPGKLARRTELPKTTVHRMMFELMRPICTLAWRYLTAPKSSISISTQDLTRQDSSKAAACDHPRMQAVLERRSSPIQTRHTSI